jgi:hypothetical protein
MESSDSRRVILRKAMPFRSIFCYNIPGLSAEISFFCEYLCQIKTKSKNITRRSSGAYEVLLNENSKDPKI